MTQLKLPGNYHGSKTRAAPLIWQLLGDPDHYSEPFCGWASVFYARPDNKERRRTRLEVIGDSNGHITNLHRATKYDPDGLAAAAAWPAVELDLKARTKPLVEAHDDLKANLKRDPKFYDLELAAWSLWGSIVAINGLTAVLAGCCGLKRSPGFPPTAEQLKPKLEACSRRLQKAVVYSGDWTVLAGVAPLTTKLDPVYGRTVAIYLDPPYGNALDRYQSGEGIATKVRSWCLNDMAPWVRCVLSGYDNEHDELLDHGWSKHLGLARRGTGKNGTEYLWSSPACTTQQ